MPLKLHFIYFDGDEVDLIPESVKRRLRKFALAMGRCTEIPHKLEVQFLPAAVLTGDGKDLNWGHFFIENDLPVIQLACAKTWKTTEGMAAGMEQVKDTLAHEISHYEQWRDGKDHHNERGRAVRARNLVRLAEEEMR